MNINKHANALK